MRNARTARWSVDATIKDEEAVSFSEFLIAFTSFLGQAARLRLLSEAGVDPSAIKEELALVIWMDGGHVGVIQRRDREGALSGELFL